jgi:2-polyprenyl-3-methyl-5-hydroxy-6-metoxy-1,4-benzoquinol methylase
MSATDRRLVVASACEACPVPPGADDATTCNLCATTFAVAAGRLFEKDGHAIVRCPSCGLVYRASVPSRSELDAIYDESYFGGAGDADRTGYLDYVGDADAHRANARRRLHHLATFVDVGRLLDVGCAAGFFVEEAGRAGWSAAGVDVSRAMVDWGIANLGADLRVGTLDDVAIRNVDCVTMWDYIEHAVDPRRDVESAYRRLRPGGALALSTGDAGALLPRLSLRRWHLMTPEHHNFFFTRETLGRLVRSAGFEIIDVAYPSSVYPLRYLAHKACLTFDVAVLDAVSRRLSRSPLGARAIPFNLWDVMTVVARKPSDAPVAV